MKSNGLGLELGQRVCAIAWMQTMNTWHSHVFVLFGFLCLCIFPDTALYNLGERWPLGIDKANGPELMQLG